MNTDETRGVKDVAHVDNNGDRSLGIGVDPCRKEGKSDALLGLWTEHLDIWMSKEMPCKGDEKAYNASID